AVHFQSKYPRSVWRAIRSRRPRVERWWRRSRNDEAVVCRRGASESARHTPSRALVGWPQPTACSPSLPQSEEPLRLLESFGARDARAEPTRFSMQAWGSSFDPEAERLSAFACIAGCSHAHGRRLRLRNRERTACACAPLERVRHVIVVSRAHPIGAAAWALGA